MKGIPFRALADLTGAALGVFDVPCPECGPGRNSPQNRTRRVLRVWRTDPSFAGYLCARCGVKGWSREDGSSRKAVDSAQVAKIRAAIADREEHHVERGRLRALALWRRGLKPQGSPVENYLDTRAIRCPIPATIRFLPPIRRGWHPALIAAFGIPDEPDPGELWIRDENVRGVQLTLLRADGSGKAGTDRDKISVGRGSAGSPIVLAPPNDLLGLAIAEGIEDALSVHMATGLGAWAAGGGSRLPALAAAVPEWIDAVTVFMDQDETGRLNAPALARALVERGIATELVTFGPSVGPRAWRAAS